MLSGIQGIAIRFHGDEDKNDSEAHKYVKGSLRSDQADRIGERVSA